MSLVWCSDWILIPFVLGHALYLKAIHAGTTKTDVIDAPPRRDLAAAQFAKYQPFFTNLVWAASKILPISLEVDCRKTDYIAFANADGVAFLAQALWRI